MVQSLKVGDIALFSYHSRVGIGEDHGNVVEVINTGGRFLVRFLKTDFEQFTIFDYMFTKLPPVLAALYDEGSDEP